MNRISTDYFDKNKRAIKKAPFIPEEREYETERAVGLGFGLFALGICILAAFVTMPVAVIAIAAIISFFSFVTAAVAQHYGSEGILEAKRTNAAVREHNKQVDINLEQDKKASEEKAKTDLTEKMQAAMKAKVEQRQKELEGNRAERLNQNTAIQQALEDKLRHEIERVRLQEQYDKDLRAAQGRPPKDEEAKAKAEEEKKAKQEAEDKKEADRNQIVGRIARLGISSNQQDQRQARLELQNILNKVDNENVDHAYNRFSNINDIQSYLALLDDGGKRAAKVKVNDETIVDRGAFRQ